MLQKFLLFIKDHLPSEFWKSADDLYDQKGFPSITTANFIKCLKDVYKARSEHLHKGIPFPAHVEFGLRDRVPFEAVSALTALHGKQHYVPSLSWFEHVIHVTLVEYMRRSFAPHLSKIQQERAAEKERLLKLMEELPTGVQSCLKRLAHWTVRFVGCGVINPHAPNKEWADNAGAVRILSEAGLVDGKGEGLDGSSWLKDLEVGEAVGEFAFGPANNPFRGAELLLPKDFQSVFNDAE